MTARRLARRKRGEVMKKKQVWTGIRIGPVMYKEIKAISKAYDRPMSTIIRKLWNKHRKEVLKNGI